MFFVDFGVYFWVGFYEFFVVGGGFWGMMECYKEFMRINLEVYVEIDEKYVSVYNFLIILWIN